jgi:hypothetical protein
LSIRAKEAAVACSVPDRAIVGDDLVPLKCFLVVEIAAQNMWSRDDRFPQLGQKGQRDVSVNGR